MTGLLLQIYFLEGVKPHDGLRGRQHETHFDRISIESTAVLHSITLKLQSFRSNLDRNGSHVAFP
jgi:hypothetical protein